MNGLRISHLFLSYRLLFDPESSFFLDSASMTEFVEQPRDAMLTEFVEQPRDAMLTEFVEQPRDAVLTEFVEQPRNAVLTESQFVDDDRWQYYLISQPGENQPRFLFPPVTLLAGVEPCANSLSELLQYCSARLLKSFVSNASNPIRVVVPIGEISRLFAVPLAPAIHHMVTMIMDFLPLPDDSSEEFYPPRQSVNVRIVDSYSRSFPGCQQSNAIRQTVAQQFRINSFQREYLRHQSWLDLDSCGFFTLKVIKKALSDHIWPHHQNKFLVPIPNTFITTSDNWLTPHNRQDILDHLTEYFTAQSLTEKESDDLICE